MKTFKEYFDFKEAKLQSHTDILSKIDGRIDSLIGDFEINARDHKRWQLEQQSIYHPLITGLLGYRFEDKYSVPSVKSLLTKLPTWLHGGGRSHYDIENEMRTIAQDVANFEPWKRGQPVKPRNEIEAAQKIEKIKNGLLNLKAMIHEFSDHYDMNAEKNKV